MIAYDSDGPGQAASQRAIALLSEVGVATRVIAMSGAKDPDEYIKKFGATRFKMLLDGANNPVEFELLKFKKTVDMDTEDGKLAYLRKGISVLSGLKNPLERELYAARLAEESGVTRATVLDQVNSQVAKQKRIAAKREWNEIQSGRQLYQDRVNPQRASHLKQALAEEGIILYLFKNPDSFDYVRERLTEEYFVTDFNRKIFSLLLEKLKNSPNVDLSMISGNLSPEVF